MGILRGSFHLFQEGAPSPLSAPSELILKFIRRQIQPGSILELGGGQGAYSFALHREGLDVTVADINSDHLEIAAKAGLRTLLVEPDQSFPVRAWDNVVLIEVLEHLEDPARLLATACGAARKRVIVTVPRSEDFSKLFSMRLSYNHIAVTDHLRHFGEEEIRDLLAPWEGRYSIERVEPIHPESSWTMVRASFRSRILAELCLLPLRLANRLRWAHPLYHTRFLISIDLRQEIDTTKARS